VQQCLDECAPQCIGIGVAGEAVLQLGTRVGRVTQQQRAAHGGRPQSVVAAEQGGQRLPKLLRLEGPVLKERELPAIERLAELGIVVRECESRQQVDGEAGAERVEARRLAGGLRGGDRQDRTDPVGTPVEPLE